MSQKLKGHIKLAKLVECFYFQGNMHNLNDKTIEANIIGLKIVAARRLILLRDKKHCFQKRIQLIVFTFICHK